jgi:hypothetical protein
MKKITNKKLYQLLPISLILVGVLVLFTISCKKDKKTSPKDTCETINIGCGDVEACCSTSSSCYYLFNGTKYPCDGSDCSAAATDVVNACMGVNSHTGISGVPQQELLKKVQKLLQTVN